MSHELKVQEILGFRLVSANPSRLAEFYRAIGFAVDGTAPISDAEMKLLGLHGGGSRVSLLLGPSRLELDGFEHGGRPYPREARACDLIFQHLALVCDNAEAAWRLALAWGATPISREGPVTLPASSGGVTAVKFRDPEGHPLEFLQFPPGDAPLWRGTGIMGIDHSAMSTGDVAAAQKFYAGLGWRQDDGTLNQGPTQEALDGLDGVKVDVAPMHGGESPPHIELLGYRQPTGRADLPRAVNDIAATRIVFRSDRDALIRNPDGHFHQLRR